VVGFFRGIKFISFCNVSVRVRVGFHSGPDPQSFFYLNYRFGRISCRFKVQMCTKLRGKRQEAIDESMGCLKARGCGVTTIGDTVDILTHVVFLDRERTRVVDVREGEIGARICWVQEKHTRQGQASNAGDVSQDNVAHRDPFLCFLFVFCVLFVCLFVC
jgi:hypothetical protein